MKNGPHKLRVYSLNCRKSKVVLHSLLNSIDPSRYDALCLQELPLDIDKRPSFRNLSHCPLFPSTSPHRNDKPIRSMIYINTAIPSDSYEQLPIDSLDLTGFTLRTQCNDNIRIFSVYNPPSSYSTISLLATTLSSLQPFDLILIGDFNKRDPLWTGHLHPERTTRSDSTLLTLLAEHGLRLCLPPGTPTFLSDAHDTQSTLDLVFCSEILEEQLTACTTDYGHTSDHSAVFANFDIDTERREPEVRPQFRACDWTAYADTFGQAIRTEPSPTTLDTRARVDNSTRHLKRLMSAALQQHVPKAKQLPYSKRWWTRELSDLRLQANQAQRAAQKNPSPVRIATMEATRNKYQKRIEKTKRQHWKDWVEAADEQTIWTASKYVSNPSSASSARIPELRDAAGNTASTNTQKCELLRRTFFPDAPPVDLDDIDTSARISQLPDITITEDAVRQCIRELSPYKATGPDGIPNVAIQAVEDHIAAPLTAIANACLRLGYFPSAWKIFTTITLRKPGKNDYTVPKAYQPIALHCRGCARPPACSTRGTARPTAREPLWRTTGAHDH